MSNIIYVVLVLATLTTASKGADLKPSATQANLETPSSKLSFSENFHLFLNYTTGNFNLNLADPNGLPVEPQSGLYEDSKPVSGVFSGGNVGEFRAVLALLVPYRRQLFRFGIGLGNAEYGKSGKSFSKGLSSASLHTNAITMEAAVIKKIPRIGYTKGIVALDTMIDGQLKTRYQVRADGTSSSINSNLSSGHKLTIAGEYHVNITRGFSMGANIGLQYGLMKFNNHSGQSSLYGLHYGLSLLLRI